MLVGALNQAPRFYSAPVAIQAAAGAAVVLAVEFASGCVLNLWLGLGVWDYSGLPGNVLGQICPAFGLLWFLLMPFAIWAEDTARWCIWFYEMSLMPPGKPDVKTPLPALYSPPVGQPGRCKTWGPGSTRPQARRTGPLR